MGLNGSVRGFVVFSGFEVLVYYGVAENTCVAETRCLVVLEAEMLVEVCDGCKITTGD